MLYKDVFNNSSLPQWNLFLIKKHYIYLLIVTGNVNLEKKNRLVPVKTYVMAAVVPSYITA